MLYRLTILLVTFTIAQRAIAELWPGQLRSCRLAPISWYRSLTVLATRQNLSESILVRHNRRCRDAPCCTHKPVLLGLLVLALGGALPGFRLALLIGASGTSADVLPTTPDHHRSRMNREVHVRHPPIDHADVMSG